MLSWVIPGLITFSKGGNARVRDMSDTGTGVVVGLGDIPLNRMEEAGDINTLGFLPSYVPSPNM